MFLFSRGQKEQQLLWQHTGWQTFESPPDAVCFFPYCSCYCTLVALWSMTSWHLPCPGSACHTLLLLYYSWLHVSVTVMVTWHFSLLFTACTTSLINHPLPFYPFFNVIPSSLPSHPADLLPLRRQEAVCGHAGKTADGHRRQKDVRAFWQHRGVYGAARPWRYQQR